MSETHAIVSGVLADMGVPHKNEERTPDGYTSLDILLTGRPGEKVRGERESRALSYFSRDWI